MKYLQIANRRTHLQRVKWGLVMGTAEILDGVVSIVTLGHVWPSFGLETAFALELREARKRSQGRYPEFDALIEDKS